MTAKVRARSICLNWTLVPVDTGQSSAAKRAAGSSHTAVSAFPFPLSGCCFFLAKSSSAAIDCFHLIQLCLRFLFYH